MCVVSMIMDYGNRMPSDWWNRQKYTDFRRLIEQGQKFDQRTDQPHCEDPEKMKLLKRIEERLDALEKAVKKPKARKRRAKK